MNAQELGKTNGRTTTMAAASRMTAGQDCIYSTVDRFKRGDFGTRRIHVSAGPKADGRGTEEGTPKLPFSPLDNLSKPNMSQRRRTTTDPHGSENTPPVGGRVSGIGGKTQRANIKDKISQWEGKESTHPPSPSPGPTRAVKRTESLTKTKSKENISKLWGSRPCSPLRLEHTRVFKEHDGKPSQSHEGESSSDAACKEDQNPVKENVGRVGGSRPCSPAESVDSNSGKPCDKERGENCRRVAPKEQHADGKENVTKPWASRPCSPVESEHAGTLKGCGGKPSQSGNTSCKENQQPVKENAGKLVGPRAGTPVEAADQPTESLKKSDGRRTAERSDQEKRAVFTLFRKLEQNAQNHSKTPAELGNYFCPPSRDRQVEAKRKEIESMISPCGEARDEGRRRRPQLYITEPGSTPPINPVPKPQRTFQHPALPGGRNLPPLPSVSPPPAPSQPPAAGGYKRPRGGRYRDTTNRKSDESEDLPESRGPPSGLLFSRRLSQEHHYEVIPDSSKENPYEDIEVDSQSSQQSLPSSPGADSTIKASRPGFFRQNSNRSFKLLDLRRVNQHQRTRSTGGLPSPPQLSPPSTPCASPENAASSWLPGDTYNRTFRRIPTGLDGPRTLFGDKPPFILTRNNITRLQVVLKINSIFEARIGKKHLRRVYHYAETSSGRVTDDNSDSESEVEERIKAERQRLVSVQSILSQPNQNQVHHNNSSLDKTLKQELLQRQLFEYFLVVSLHRPKAGGPYLPEVTQQFPVKLERSFKFMRETEDQLRIIPQFCFPDAKDWQPVESFPSEMFSFVLTGEDGSRRFGYCRRLLPSGRGKRLPEVYCIVSHLGCFNLFSKVLDEVERRRALSPALVQPFMRAIMEAQFPAPGRTITIKTFLPGSGTETMELCRPSDSRLEHVDFECLFSCLNPRLLFKVLGSLLLERRVIFTADKLSTLSQCCHAMVALLYPFVWQHTYIPVLPSAMLDIVCTPTPFIVGLLSSSLPQLTELPLEEVLVVDLVNSRLLRQLEDEDTILPSKLQSALENVLERRKELANERGGDESSSDSTVVSEAFVRFFVELVGHYPLFVVSDREDGYSSSSSSPAPCSFRREGFCKSVSSKTTRRFLEVFMETQMFGWFIQERELHRRVVRGLFEQRVQEYLESIRDNEHRRVNRFLKGLGNKMKFLSKK